MLVRCEVPVRGERQETVFGCSRPWPDGLDASEPVDNWSAHAMIARYGRDHLISQENG